MKTEEGIIYLPDFMIALIAIEDNPGKSITDIHYKTKITYSHLHKIKTVLVNKGWIVYVKEDKKHILSLTEKGKEILKDTYILLKGLDITKEQVYEFKKREKKENKEPVKQFEGIKMEGVNN